MVQRRAGSHDLPRSDRTLGPQVPVLATVTSPPRYISTSSCCGGYPSPTRELPALPNGSQVLEVRKAVRRPCPLQSVLTGATRLTIRSQACFPLSYLCRRLLLQRVEVAESGNVGGDAPVVEFASRFVQLVVLRHWSDDTFFEPSREGFNRLAPHCWLGVNMEDVRGTSRTVVFGEPGYCAVVQ